MLGRTRVHKSTSHLAQHYSGSLLSYDAALHRLVTHTENFCHNRCTRSGLPQIGTVYHESSSDAALNFAARREHTDFISRLTMVSISNEPLGHGGGEVLFMLFMPGSREALETCSLLIDPDELDRSYSRYNLSRHNF